MRQALELALEALENNRQTHHYCEDTWYSCPKHEEGCANESEGDECNCGADEANAEIDKAITAIKEALAQPEQEPVAWMHPDGRLWTFGRCFDKSTFTIPLYTTPPQRKPLTDEQIEVLWDNTLSEDVGITALRKITRAIEAAHGIKE